MRDPAGSVVYRKKQGFATLKPHLEGCCGAQSREPQPVTTNLSLCFGPGPPDAYVAQHFGKPGGGCALRDSEGKVWVQSWEIDSVLGSAPTSVICDVVGRTVTRLDGRVATHAIHHEGPGGDFSEAFGRIGPAGKPLRTERGSVFAHHVADVEHDRHHVGSVVLGC